MGGSRKISGSTEWESELLREVDNMGILPDINVLVGELAAMLRSNIQGSGIYGGVVNALINQISTYVFNSTTAVVRVSAMRPSIYAPLGLYGAADLALVYNEDVRIKPSAIYYNKNTGMRLPIGRIPGFSHRGGHYLEKTVNEFNTKHPECTVTLS